MSRLSEMQKEGYEIEKVFLTGKFGKSTHIFIPTKLSNSLKGKLIYILKKDKKICIISDDCDLIENTDK